MKETDTANQISVQRGKRVKRKPSLDQSRPVIIKQLEDNQAKSQIESFESLFARINRIVTEFRLVVKNETSETVPAGDSNTLN